MGKIYCRECIEEVPDTSDVCPKCKKPLTLPPDAIARNKASKQKKLDEERDRQETARKDAERKKNLISCPDCGKEVSKSAEKCPQCGCPASKFPQPVSPQPQHSLNQEVSLFRVAILLVPFVFFLNSLGTRRNSPTRNETTQAYQQKEWFQGGTLHSASIQEWKRATYENKLATAGDWLAATKWKGSIKSQGDFVRLKVCAARLAGAVDTLANNNSSEKLGVSIRELAASIITMANDLGPY